jgi:hypothetical protein
MPWKMDCIEEINALPNLGQRLFELLMATTKDAEPIISPLILIYILQVMVL